VALPMPDPAPVTSVTLSSSSIEPRSIGIALCSSDLGLATGCDVRSSVPLRSKITCLVDCRWSGASSRRGARIAGKRTMEPARPPNYRFRGIVSVPAVREQPLSYFDSILWIGSVTVEGIFPVGKASLATGTSQPGENNEPSNAEGNHGG
jgi:hypothetical protein